MFFVLFPVWKLRVKKIKYKESITIKITCILIRYYGKERGCIKGRGTNRLVFFYEECKDLSRKFQVLMSEFDNLNKLFYE
jgi:hypothetical protein